MEDKDRNRLEALLNLLADEVAQRLEERLEPKRVDPEPPPVVPSVSSASAASELMAAPESEQALEAILETAPNPEAEPEPLLELEPNPEVSQSSHAASLMARLALGVLLIVVLINIPFNAQGMAIARSIPNNASLIIRNGLVVKEATSPDVWVYRDGAFRWISSLDAFQHYGYRWQDVHVVEPGFLDEFEKGSPLYILLKCNGSPHVYGLEAGGKRWIVDIPTFQSEGYEWRDIKFVPCDYLRGLPDGESIPPGRGSPPPPLP